MSLDFAGFRSDTERRRGKTSRKHSKPTVEALEDRWVPAIAYVSPAFALPGGTLVDGDAGTAGPQNANVGATAFTSIQTAINSLGVGDTVIVNSGSYAEAVNLGNNKIMVITTGAAVTTNSLTTSAGTSVQILGSSLTTGDASNTPIGGVISGGGNFIKQGSGIVTFTGPLANTYTGSTTVNAGTLVLGKAGADLAINGGSITVNSAGTLEVASSETSVPINFGTGGTVQVDGGATLSLTANQTQNVGLLLFNGGTVQVTAGTGLYTVGGGPTGGVIMGSGTLNANLQNAGTVNPGSIAGVSINLVGALSVTGTYTQTSAGTLKLDMSGASTDQLSVGGTVKLDGTLTLGILGSTFVAPAPGTLYNAFSWGASALASTRRLASSAASYLPSDFATKNLSFFGRYFEARYSPSAVVSGTYLNSDFNSNMLSFAYFPSPASAVASNLQVTRSGFVGTVNNSTYYQTVTLKNTSATGSMTGPIYFEIYQYGTLPVPQLINRQGFTQFASTGRQYLVASPGNLAPGASVTFQLKFYKPSLSFQIAYNYRVLANGAP